MGWKTRSRILTAVLSAALGGCVVVLPACPGPTSIPTDASVPTPTAPAPLEPTAPPAPPPETSGLVEPAPLSRYAVTVLEDGPVAYWRFEEDQGSVAMDTSGRRRDGLYLDRPTVGDSVGARGTGIALGLRTNRDGMVVGYAPWTNMSDLTVEAWVRASRVATPEGMIIVDKGNTWNLFIDALGRPAFQLPGNTPPETLAPTSILPGQDYHLVGTFEDGAMALHVNGVLVSYGTASVREIPENPSPIHVGRGLGAERFELYGVVDDVALYDRALSPATILRHYRAGR